MNILNEFYGKRISLAFWVLIVFMAAMTACSNPGLEEGSDQKSTENTKTLTKDFKTPPNDGKESASLQEENKEKLAGIVFITTSQACDCTMNRCKSVEQVLNSLLAEHPEAPAVKKIDIATEKERAADILERYPAVMLPVIYFLDKNGNLLEKLDGEVLEEEVRAALEKYSGVEN